MSPCVNKIFHIGMEEQIIGSNRLLKGPQLPSYHQTVNRPTDLGQEPEINSAWNAVVLIRRTGSVFTHHIGSSWTRLNKNERKSFPTSALLGGTEEAISRGGLVNPVSSNRDSRPPSPSDTAPGPGAGQLGYHYQKGAQTRRSQEKPAPSISGNIVRFIFQHLGV